MATWNSGRASRRTFLGSAGATLIGAGTTLAGRTPRLEASQAAPQPRKKEVKLRMAVVGGGFGATFHWHEHPHCEVTAVTDLRADRRQKLVDHYGCLRVYTSMEEMLKTARGSFDAVAIFTEAPNHARHVLACFEAGKHVVSACPVATSLEDLHRIKEAKERTGLRYMMAESSYYRQECIAARELFQKGEFGRLLYSEVEYYHPGIGGRRDPLSWYDGQRTWRHGYPPMLYPTHSLGFLVGVTRERIVKVSCQGQLVGDFPAGKENAYDNPFNNEMALGRTNQNNTCRFGVFWQVAASGERAQWLGEKMSCYMASSGGQPASRTVAGQPSRPWEVPEYWKTEALPPEMRHKSGHGGSAVFLSAEFVNALIEKREPTVDLYESIAMTAPGIVAHQSAQRDGELIDVPSFDKA